MALFGKKKSSALKAAAIPKAFTTQIDLSKFNLATKPSGLVNEQLATLKQRITKLSSMVENNLMNAIRAATKKNKELAISIFTTDEQYIQKLKFEVEYMTLAYLNFQNLDEAANKSVADARFILKKLETLGQLALNIANKTEYIQLANIEVLHKDEYDLKPMGDDTAEMVKKAVEAYVSGNSKHAVETLDMMKKIEDIYQKAVVKLKAETNDSNITNFTGILSVVEYVHDASLISCEIAKEFC